MLCDMRQLSHHVALLIYCLLITKYLLYIFFTSQKEISIPNLITNTSNNHWLVAVWLAAINIAAALSPAFENACNYKQCLLVS